LDGTSISLIVLPDDMDFFWHMNNSSYNKNADFARYDFLICTGIWDYTTKNKLFSANGGMYFKFKRQLNLLQRYYIKTQLLSIDEKWLYLQHTFLDSKTNKEHAVGFCKLVFKKNREDIPPAFILKELGYEKWLETNKTSKFGVDLKSLEQFMTSHTDQ